MVSGVEIGQWDRQCNCFAGIDGDPPAAGVLTLGSIWEGGGSGTNEDTKEELGQIAPNPAPSCQVGSVGLNPGIIYDAVCFATWQAADLANRQLS